MPTNPAQSHDLVHRVPYDRVHRQAVERLFEEALMHMTGPACSRYTLPNRFRSAYDELCRDRVREGPYWDMRRKTGWVKD